MCQADEAISIKEARDCFASPAYRQARLAMTTTFKITNTSL